MNAGRKMKHRTLRTIAFFMAAAALLLGGCAPRSALPGDAGTAVATQTENSMQPDDTVMIDAADVVNYTAEDIRRLQTESGKQAAVAIDIVCQLCSANFRKSDVRSIMVNIRNLGIRRVYLIMCSPGYPVMAGGMITAIRTGLASTDVVTALNQLGEDPNKVFIEMCHEYGLEAIAVIKPYEGGGGVTIPEGTTLEGVASEYSPTAAPEAVGGCRAFVDSFIAEHPEMRVQRKPGTGEDAAGPVTAMEIYYQIGSDTTDLAAANRDAANAPTVWVSQDNAGYSVWEDITWEYTLAEQYPICDANGVLLFNRDCVRLRIEINGLPASYDYVACSLSDQNFLMNADYWCRPYSMARLWSGSDELPSTLGYYVRTPYDSNATPETMIWGSYGSPVSPTDLKGVRVESDGSVTGVYKDGVAPTGAEEFYNWGFEYEFVYTSAVTNGFLSPVIALGVGKNEYVQGLLCEGYEEVRDYWLEQVRTALSYGADGIDIRWDGHSAMVSDYYYYGYNQPIADEYERQYGVALADEPVNTQTATRVMSIRGEFFLQFLEAASELTHASGAIFLSHFFATSYTDDIGSDSYEPSTAANHVAQWKMPKIIVRDYRKVIDLCDEIVYKDYFTKYYPASDQSLGQILTDCAHSQGKRIWIHCYVQQNPQQLNAHYLENFVESQADGMILYEITESYDYGTTAQFLGDWIDGDPAYSFSIMGRISGISQGTTAGELIGALCMLGSNVVVDAEGRSVPLDTVLTGDMRLCLNGTCYYTFSIQN